MSIFKSGELCKSVRGIDWIFMDLSSCISLGEPDIAEDSQTQENALVQYMACSRVTEKA